MQKDGIITLPKSGQPATGSIQVVRSEDLLLSIGVAGSHAMSSLKNSAAKLVDTMEKSNDPKHIVGLANALATTIQTQVNVVKAMMDFQRGK